MCNLVLYNYSAECLSMLNLISVLFYIIDSILILNFNAFIFMHAIIAA